jgi:hypothetical protein
MDFFHVSTLMIWTAPRPISSGAVEYLQRARSAARCALHISITLEPTPILNLKKEETTLPFQACDSRGSTAPVILIKL